MATISICDGCKQPVTGAITQVGLVRKNEYCEPCSVIAKDMLAEVDQLHDKMADMWHTQLSSIQDSFRAKLETLPDEQPEHE
jgi:hypothetical protein